MPTVQSSMISSIDYDDTTQTLTITFKNGSRYAYAGVPPEAHDALMSADSIGSEFLASVRDVYAGRRV